MNPSERQRLLSLRKRLDLAFRDLSDFLDTIGMTEAPLDNTHTADGPVVLNQHFPSNPYLARGTKDGEKYWARLRDLGYTPPCSCEFGWQPECPAHGDDEHRVPDEDRADMVADHQNERPRVTTYTPADPRTHHWAGCDHNHGPESWCPTTPQSVIDRQNALLRGDDHEVVTAEEAEAARQARCGTPTPKDLFGNGEEQVGG